jgi:hypothetical protein
VDGNLGGAQNFKLHCTIAPSGSGAQGERDVRVLGDDRLRAGQRALDNTIRV